MLLKFIQEQIIDPQAFLARVEELKTHPEESYYDVLQFKDGREIERIALPQRLGEKVVGRVLSFRDITERKQAEQALKQSHDELEIRVSERTNELQTANTALIAEKTRQEELIAELEATHNQLLQSEKMASLGQLAAGVAHEINNPVGFVSSNLSTLQTYADALLKQISFYEEHESAYSNSAQQECIKLKADLDLDFLRRDLGSLLVESMDGLQRIKRIVQDLKDFSHTNDAEWQLANLEQGMDSTLNMVWNELKYKTEVIKEYGNIPHIVCIPSQLNQVFMNLLMNAAQSIEGHGRITIRTGQEDENVWVEVTDTGSGIDPKNLKRIFDPFFTTKPVGQGTGLGLSLSFGIVEKHGGHIDIKTEVGVGSTFRVILPVNGKPEAE